jgi:predicted Zn-dependent protease
MTKIDWKRKLTSRKFWVSITGFVTAILIALGADDNTQVQITAIIAAAAQVIGYTLAEGLTDAAKVETLTNNTEED